MTILELWEERENFKYSTTTDSVGIGDSHKRGGYIGKSRSYLIEASWMVDQLDKLNYDAVAYREVIEAQAPDWVKPLILNDWNGFNKLLERSQMSWMKREDCLDVINNKDIGNRLLNSCDCVG